MSEGRDFMSEIVVITDSRMSVITTMLLSIQMSGSSIIVLIYRRVVSIVAMV